jgi:Zn-dependent protease
MREFPTSTTFHWTVPLGRWGQTLVRLHVFFVLALVWTLYLSWLVGQRPGVENGLWLALLGVSILTLSVALHVAAHIYAATQLQASAGELTIGPQGDFSTVVAPHDPRSQIAISLAGPAVNLLVALACLPGVLASGEVAIWGLLNPFAPSDLVSGTPWSVVLKLTLWMNASLAFLNLLPARPMDGGPAALALAHLLYPRASRRRIEMFMARVGVFTGFGLLIAAALSRDAGETLVPAWFSLTILAVLILFSAQRTPSQTIASRAPDDELFGYDFSQGYTSLERSHARVDEAEADEGPLERWLETRREQRRERQEQLEAEEDARVDEILARVHQHGLGGLSPEERMLLNRVSMRYRTRMDQS